MDLKKAKDHWSFLEEIEAPMWVDLSLEAKSNYRDIDDEWFHISHMFHKCSSRELKSAFAHCGEGSECSPKIPSSVSRSRGKDYKSKKWVRNDSDLSSNLQHPVKALNEKSSRANSRSDEEIKPKLSFASTKGTSRSSVSNTSTITIESDHKPQQTSLEVSSQAFGHTGGLLSALKVSLRKSCVTRQASRVEVKNDGRQSRDRKSSSSKSSVGSSSYSGQHTKNSTFTLLHNKEQQNTPESRNVEKLTEAAKNRMKESIVGKASNVQKKAEIRLTEAAKNRLKESIVVKASSVQRTAGINNSRRTASSNAMTKPKVQTQNLRGKATPLLQIQKEHRSLEAATTKPKEKAVRIGYGKENAPRRKIHLGQKVIKKIEQKDRETGMPCHKEKINNPTKGNRSTNASRRVCLR